MTAAHNAMNYPMSHSTDVMKLKRKTFCISQGIAGTFAKCGQQIQNHVKFSLRFCEYQKLLRSIHFQSWSLAARWRQTAYAFTQ